MLIVWNLNVHSYPWWQQPDLATKIQNACIWHMWEDSLPWNSISMKSPVFYLATISCSKLWNFYVWNEWIWKHVHGNFSTWLSGGFAFWITEHWEMRAGLECQVDFVLTRLPPNDSFSRLRLCNPTADVPVSCSRPIEPSEAETTWRVRIRQHTCAGCWRELFGERYPAHRGDIPGRGVPHTN